ncbi:MAG: hypothetical protein ACLFRG_10870 [Desulfococcaceae bacterium]
MEPSARAALETFLSEWAETPEGNRRAFVRLRDFLADLDDVTLDFQPRPGVTYSLRAAHDAQKDRQLFVMVDVIEDTPRWLSICFYSDLIDDPDEQGDEVPEGLLGEDATCFDLETYDEEMLAYVEARLQEAARRVSGEDAEL